MGHGIPYNMNWTGLIQSLLLVVHIKQITCGSVQFLVPEELESGTLVGSLREYFPPPYQLLTSEYLRMDNKTGDIYTTQQKMDREDLCPTETDNEKCVIRQHAIWGPSGDLIQFSVIIEDINDNAPHFENSEFYLMVPEDVTVGTSFLLDGGAQDRDIGPNGELRYHLEGSDGVFALKAEEDTFLAIHVQKALDREIQGSFLMQLVATDCGDHPLNASATLLVTVTDVNDNCPKFSSNSTSNVTLNGDSPKDMVVAQVTATDPDIGPNAAIVYSFSLKVSQRAMQLFSLNSQTGHIRLAQDLHNEKSEELVLIVLATGPHCPPAVTQVTISVLPKVNQELTIKIRFIAELQNQTMVLPENQPPTVLAVLELEGDSSFKDSSLTIEGDVPFSLNEQKGKYRLSTSKSLDYEMKQEHSISVMAHWKKADGSVITSQREKIKVLVADVNDNAPHFLQSQYQLEVEENNQPGLSLLRVSASDADSGDNGRVTYKLHKHTSAIFNMNSVTGQLSVLVPLDREQQDTYNLTVFAQDGGSPPLGSHATVIIRVLDQNDNAPIFVTPHFIFFIPENTPPFAQVGKIDVKDPDKEENGKTRLQVVNNNVPFVVENTQRTLRTTTHLDRETEDHYELYILASDNGHPVALTSTARVSVFVEDINDNQPKVIVPSSNSSCLTVSPGTLAGTMVTKIYAIDEDSGLNSEITYYVVAKETPQKSCPFQVDSRSGNITLSQQLLHKDMGMHHLFIVVRDSGKPTPLYTTIWINLLVNESMEHCYLDKVPERTWSPDLTQSPSKVSTCERDSTTYERVTLFISIGMFLASMVFFLTTCLFLRNRSLRKNRRRKMVENEIPLRFNHDCSDE